MRAWACHRRDVAWSCRSWYRFTCDKALSQAQSDASIVSTSRFDGAIEWNKRPAAPNCKIGSQQHCNSPNNTDRLNRQTGFDSEIVLTVNSGGLRF